MRAKHHYREKYWILDSEAAYLLSWVFKGWVDRPGEDALNPPGADFEVAAGDVFKDQEELPRGIYWIAREVEGSGALEVMKVVYCWEVNKGFRIVSVRCDRCSNEYQSKDIRSWDHNHTLETIPIECKCGGFYNSTLTNYTLHHVYEIESSDAEKSCAIATVERFR